MYLQFNDNRLIAFWFIKSKKNIFTFFSFDLITNE